MSYPFCAEEVSDEAVVCIDCQRDLSIPRAYWVQLNAQAAQIAALKNEIAELRDRDPTPRDKWVGIVASTIPSVAGRFALAFAGLLVAYYIIVWIFDLNTLILRLASIAIPMLCAVAYPMRRRPHSAIMIGMAAALGVLAVLTMSAITGWQEHIPVAPRDWREAREIAEYICSIALSFITGDLIARALAQHYISKAAAQVTASSARLIKLLDIKRETLEWRLSITARFIEIGTPIVTAIGALVTGVLSLIG